MKLLSVDKDESILDGMANLYLEVWNNEGHSIKERLLKHRSYNGYRGLVMYSDKDEVVGFAYGYTSLPGQYYHELLSKEFDSKEYQKWLNNCFEFVELAVHPRFRKMGLGKELVTQLLEGAPNKTAILTTQSDNEPARALYGSLNWTLLKKTFYPHDLNHPYVIMGKELF